MTAPSDIALLPAGLADSLPPDAAREAGAVEALLACFERYGYERVKPPLVEFEDTLLAGVGAGMSAQTFRLMDPVSQRMMGLRADMTLQIARIATTRLAMAARPLRLSYVGEVMRVRGTQLAPNRQLRQVGAELFGAPQAAADAEVVVMAAEALGGAGLSGLSVDLNSPRLVPAVVDGLGLDLDPATAEALRRALDHKDAAGVAASAGKDGALLGAMMAAAGPADAALAALDRLDFPPAAGEELARLSRVVALVRAGAPELGLTVDPVENRGFEYHTGVSFTLFAVGVRGELGRGGRYLAGAAPGECATGLTLFMDPLLRGLPPVAAADRLFLPSTAPPAEARRLRQAGWVVIAGLDPAGDVGAEARRLGCSHAWIDGAAVALDGGD